MNETNGFWGKTYHKNDDIIARKIADETILVPICGNVADMQRIFMLNPVAESIWQQLDTHQPLKDIRVQVLDQFDVGQAEAEKDIKEFIHELIDLELISEIV